MLDLPGTPDFDVWPVTHRAVSVRAAGEEMAVSWSDGLETRHHALMLRENSPDPETIHPQAREMAISPLDYPADIAVGAPRSTRPAPSP